MKKSATFAFLIFVSAGLCAQTSHARAVTDTASIIRIVTGYNASHFHADTTDLTDDPDYNLLAAASLGRCDRIYSLWRRGASVNHTAGEMAAPLHYAISYGRTEPVELLLLMGADPDQADIYGNTPLILAVRADKPEIAEKLIRHGASPAIGDRHNSTPLHHAVALGNFLMSDMLLYYDAPLEIRDGEGNTPLMTATGFGYAHLADLLLQSGSDPDAADRHGFTPLLTAAQNGDTLIMSLLLDYGANLYAVNDEGADALALTILFSQEEAAGFLLDKGNRWGNNGEKGYDPVKLANSYGESRIIRIMNGHGLKGRRELSFNQLTITGQSFITLHYSLTGGEVSFTEPGLKAGVTAGGASDLYPRYILTLAPDMAYYQYRVRTSLLYGGIFKDIRLTRHFSRYDLSLVPSLNLGYRFHSKYEGSDDKPDDRVVLMPGADARLRWDRLAISAGMLFLKMPFDSTPPVWLTLKGSWTVTRPAMQLTSKRIRLYSYDEN